MRYVFPQIGTMMTLLLIATSINSVHLSLQQDYQIQNVGNILIRDNYANILHGFWIPAGKSPMSVQWTGSDLTSLAYEMLDFAENMGYNVYFLTFSRLYGTYEDPEHSGILTTNAKNYFDKYVAEADERGMKVAFYEWRVSNSFWDWFYANEPNSMTLLAPLWKSLATHFKGDDRIYGFGPPVGNTGTGKGWSFYTSQEGCDWWAPYINEFFEAVHEGDPNALAIGAPMTDMGSTETFTYDYWRPTLPALTDTGPRIWRKMTAIQYDEMDPENNAYYPYDGGDYQVMQWMNRWGESVLSEQITGFVGGGTPYMVWDARSLQWINDWMEARDNDGFSWFWESYGWKIGAMDDTGEPVRAYYTSGGVERPFVDEIRDYLNENQ